MAMLPFCTAFRKTTKIPGCIYTKFIPECMKVMAQTTTPGRCSPIPYSKNLAIFAARSARKAIVEWVPKLGR